MEIILIILTVLLLGGCKSDTSHPAGQVDTRTPPGRELRPQAAERVKELIRKSDIIVLAQITDVYDGRAKDGGMSYDVKIDRQVHGKRLSGKTFRFRSAGWIGYAEYKKGEKVLLFLRHGQDEIIQVKPVCYISEDKTPKLGGITLWPIEAYLNLITEELAKGERP